METKQLDNVYICAMSRSQRAFWMLYPGLKTPWSFTVGNTSEFDGDGTDIWWWIFETNLPEDYFAEEKLLILKRQPLTRWTPQCMTHFTLAS
jgi:hypothetical protein